MVNIFILDKTRKYHFFIGYNFAVGTKENEDYYKIEEIEEMKWEYTTGTITAGIANASSVDFTSLTPQQGYAYFIEKVGIDGWLGFQANFKGYPHNSPRREASYFYREDASRLSPIYLPHIIFAPDYPTYKIANLEASNFAAKMYFYGEKWMVTKLETPPPPPIIKLQDYMKASMPG